MRASTRTTLPGQNCLKAMKGQYGPGIKALVPTLYFGMNTSEPKILEFFEYVGISISEGELSNLLIRIRATFTPEKDEIYEAGLRKQSLAAHG